MQVRDAYADKVLRNLSVKYSNMLNGMGYISEKIFPVVKVDKKTGIYFEYDKTNLRIPSNTRRTGRARANEVTYNVTQQTYGPLNDHALEHFIDRDVLEQYDSPLEPRTDATELLTEAIWLEKENALATTLADTAIITQNTTLSGTSQWSDYANSDPFANIQTAINTVNTGSVRMPNTIFMGYDVWAKLMHHPDLLERVKYSQLAVLTLELFKSLFSESGIANVWVGNVKKNTADEGQTDAIGQVWGKHLWVAYVEPSPKIKAPSLGYTMTLRSPREVERWTEPGVKGEFVSVSDYYEQKVVAANAAYLVKNAVA